MQPWVEGVVEPLAHQRNAQDRHQDGHTGNGRDIPLHPDHAASGTNQVAPGWHVGVGQVEEGQRTLQQDGHGHDDAGVDDHRWQGIGQDLAEDQLGIAHAQAACGLHELAMAQRQKLRTCQARHRRPGHHADGQHHGTDLGTEHRHQHQQEQKVGQDLESLGDTHEQVVDPAPIETGHRPQHQADDGGNGGGHYADAQRDASAVEDLGGDIAPDLVGAQQEAAAVARPLQGTARQRQRIARIHPAGRECRDQHGQQQQQADHGGGIVEVTFEQIHEFRSSVRAIDARIQPRIQQVDQEIDGDDQQGRDEHDAQQGVQVALHHRLVGQAAQAGQGKHGFHHHRAAQHGAGLQPDQGEHGQERIAQHVAHHHGGLAHALGARGTHEVLGRDLQHGGAHDAQVYRQEDQRQRHRRQGQVPGDIADPGQAMQRDIDGFETTRGQPVQPDGEDEDAHQPEPERGRGIEHQSQCGDQRIRPALDPARGQHAQRHAEGKGDRQRRTHQQQGGRQAFGDHQRHRLAIDCRVAQVQVDQAPQVVAQAHRDRIIEPVILAQAGNHGGVAAAHLRHQRIDGIARSQLQQQEQARQDDQQGRHRRQQAARGQGKQTHGVAPYALSQVSCQLLEGQRALLWPFCTLRLTTEQNSRSVAIQIGSSSLTACTHWAYRARRLAGSISLAASSMSLSTLSDFQPYWLVQGAPAGLPERYQTVVDTAGSPRNWCQPVAMSKLPSLQMAVRAPAISYWTISTLMPTVSSDCWMKVAKSGTSSPFWIGTSFSAKRTPPLPRLQPASSSKASARLVSKGYGGLAPLGENDEVEGIGPLAGLPRPQRKLSMKQPISMACTMARRTRTSASSLRRKLNSRVLLNWLASSPLLRTSNLGFLRSRSRSARASCEQADSCSEPVSSAAVAADLSVMMRQTMRSRYGKPLRQQSGLRSAMMYWPRWYSTKRNGPVPMGAVLAGFSSTLVFSQTWRGTTQPRSASARNSRSSGIGRSQRKTTVWASGVSTACRQRCRAVAQLSCFFHSSSALYCTSAAVKGLPSCHFTPSRSLKVMVLPSAELRQEVASCGTGLPSASRSTSDSTILLVTMQTPVEARSDGLRIRCSEPRWTLSTPPRRGSVCEKEIEGQAVETSRAPEESRN
eukprot:TRINITY_DN435_c0_g2_i1.p1 TRINITY_DN435_c0_g2~~TRINITY_DN435_c0_g2_i1.p1  ORF type:complete len:1135 (-),score=399.44 TRINITY_DN435_c0_g2_i1:1781-5185(-)